MLGNNYRIVAILGAASVLASGQEQSDQTFRTSVNVVIAPTTVLDSQGNYVYGLIPSQFRLYDRGALQDIRVDEAFQPISLVVCIQADAAMEGVLPKLERMGPVLKQLVVGDHGRVAVVAFDHRIQVLQEFTNDPEKVSEAFKKLKPGSSTAVLIDSVNEAVRMLRRRPADHRGVILVVSESRDKGSEGEVRETLAAAEFQNVSVYSVVVPRVVTALTQPTPAPRPDPIPTTARHVPAGAALTPETAIQMRNYGNVVPAFEEIIRGVKAIFVPNPVEVFTKFTGGREYSFANVRGLDEALTKIGSELHSQYFISYVPGNRAEGGYHEIKVEIDRRPDLKPRTRPGYWMAAVPDQKKTGEGEPSAAQR